MMGVENEHDQLYPQASEEGSPDAPIATSTV